MTDPFIHPPSMTMVATTILFWLAEAVITLRLLVIGFRVILSVHRSRNRSLWLQSFAVKKREIRALSVTALAVGIAALAITLALALLPGCAVFGASDPLFILRTVLMNGLTIGAFGIIPFTIGRVLLWMCNRTASATRLP